MNRNPLSKNKIGYIRSLRLLKNRREYRTFVAEGSKLILDLIQNLRCQLLVLSPECEELFGEAYAEEVVYASRSDIKKASHLATPPNALAVFHQPQYDLASINYQSKLSLVLDDIQDPGNLGTIIRLADWFGIENIFCSHHTVDMYNTKTVQATMGALARVNIHYVDIETFISEANKNHEMPIYGALLDGENIYNHPLSNTALIVMGNEGRGIRSAIQPLISHRLHIPNFSSQSITSESLNVAVATAVICSEFRRR